MHVKRALALVLSLMVAGGTLSSGTAIGAVSRGAKLLHVEYRGGGVVRLYLSFYEQEGTVLYPITTLDRSMVRVNLPKVSGKDAEVSSLTTVKGAPGDTRRALAVIFNGGELKESGGAASLRSSVADLLPDLPSAYSVVAAGSGESIRSLGESTPGRAENIASLQREVLADTPTSGDLYRSAALCFAAERFASWDMQWFAPADQKVVLIVGATGNRNGTGKKSNRNCEADLVELGVRIYDVSWSELPGRALTSVDGGFHQRVASVLDVIPALVNVAANLNGEYLIDANLPEVPLTAQPLSLTAAISYHNAVIETDSGQLPEVLEELSPPPSPSPTLAVSVADVPPSAMDWRRMIVAAVAALVVVVCAVILARRLTHRAKTVACNACGQRVQKNHANCPFRNRKVVARFVVLEGKYAGHMLPLTVGDNLIARRSSAAISLSGSGVAWWRHGLLRIEGTKALYIPVTRRLRHRVNGWPVVEPRLLGKGHVLQVGAHKLRFEVRPDTWRGV